MNDWTQVKLQLDLVMLLLTIVLLLTPFSIAHWWSNRRCFQCGLLKTECRGHAKT